MKNNFISIQKKKIKFKMKFKLINLHKKKL